MEDGIEEGALFDHILHAGSAAPGSEKRRRLTSFFETTEWAIVTGIILGILFVGVLDIILQWRSGYDVLLMLAVASFAWWVVFGQLISLIIDQIETGSAYDGAVRSFHSVVFRGLCIVTITYFGRLARAAVDAGSMSPPDIIITVLVSGILFTDVYFSLQRASRIEEKMDESNNDQ